MGQYYKAITIHPESGRIDVYRSRDYDNFNKLLEHSYIGNKYTNAIYRAIHNHPMRVAWIGDYSDAYYNDENKGNYQDKIEYNEFIRFYNLCWSDTPADPRKVSFYVCPVDRDTNHTYLLNHSTKQFVDLNSYIRDRTGLIIDPLPLLTACGNGRGGGDYYGTHMDLIGTWAFDELELTGLKTKTHGYDELKIAFIEQH